MWSVCSGSDGVRDGISPVPREETRVCTLEQSSHPHRKQLTARMLGAPAQEPRGPGHRVQFVASWESLPVTLGRLGVQAIHPWIVAQLPVLGNVMKTPCNSSCYPGDSATLWQVFTLASAMNQTKECRVTMFGSCRKFG